MLRLKAHVASICFKCFRCFRDTLQLFHMDVAKVDRDVAYVAIALHVSCERLFQLIQIFKSYVASVLYGYCKSRSGCCICCNGYTRMLQASVPNVSSVFFHTYVANMFI